jgi:hypothetical protein
MGTKWYYVDNGETLGPATSYEIVKLIEGDGSQPILIWAEGLAGSLDGGATFGQVINAPAAPLSPPSAEARSTRPPAPKKGTLGRRVRNELIEYLAIAAYLAICFGALLFYKATILESEGIETTRVGLAIVKALILGKFVLILEHLKIGHGKKSARVVAFDILKKALLFTFLLFLLTIAEDVIVGYVHGEDARDAVKGIGGGTRPEAIATALLMFMVLIPYFAYKDIAMKLGEAALLKLLFARQPLPGETHANSLAVRVHPGRDPASDQPH